MWKFVDILGRNFAADNGDDVMVVSLSGGVLFYTDNINNS
jgi:hypothetical protein